VSRPTVPSNDNLAASLRSSEVPGWDAGRIAAELAKARAAHDDRCVIATLREEDAAGPDEVLRQAAIELLGLGR